MRSSLLLALCVACGVREQNTEREAGSSVVAFTLPAEDPPKLPDGDGRAEVMGNCVLCHSTRLIAGQPRLSRKAWQAEVDKMRTVYGAPVAPEATPKIVDYLVATFGVE